jgi:hypothetical protein
MKKIFISAATMLIVMAGAHAQSGLLVAAFPATADVANASFVNKHKHAFTNWAAMYQGVTAVDGSELKNKGVVFTWNEDGAWFRAFYTGGGTWLHTVRSYTEAGLPAAVKDRVRSVYYDLRISFVDEVRTPGQNTVYRVQLQNDEKMIIIKVNDDEMEKEAEYEKSK